MPVSIAEANRNQPAEVLAVTSKCSLQEIRFL